MVDALEGKGGIGGMGCPNMCSNIPSISFGPFAIEQCFMTTI